MLVGLTDFATGLSPRVRGNRTGGRHRRAGGGLSPRVRGNHRVFRPYPPGLGSIPACAGEPAKAFNAAKREEVYPRVCGGTVIERRAGHYVQGLSPRVRGNRSPAAMYAYPVCVYPRVCGGTGICHSAMPAAHGLSPRVRGNRSNDVIPAAVHRSIPACAGEPAGLGMRHRASGVYPRVCGGTWLVMTIVLVMQGLSPRVRGNPCGLSRFQCLAGSIPACAGEPEANGHQALIP